LRSNMHPPREEEGMRLFNIADGQLLRWLGPESDEERTYIREEPRRAREGWRAWDRHFRQSEAYKEWQRNMRRPERSEDDST
jgi:hypothetical protein